MSVSSVRYHQGASADVKSAVAWYRGRSPKAASDFIEELDRAVDTIRAGPDRCRWERAILDASFFGDSLFPLSIRNKKARSSFGRSRMVADDLSIGLGALNERKLQLRA